MTARRAERRLLVALQDQPTGAAAGAEAVLADVASAVVWGECGVQDSGNRTGHDSSRAGVSGDSGLCSEGSPEGGIEPTSRRDSILDALDEYLLQLEANGRSPHTVAQARRHVMALARWTDRAVEELTHQDVARFLVEQQDGRSAATLNAVRSSVRCFFAYCEEAGLVERSSARLVQRARTCPPPPRGLSDAEQDRLVAALDRASTCALDRASTWEDRRDRTLFLTLLWTGIRIGSALALTVEDVDLDAAVIRIRGKGGLRATLPISERVVELLAEWMPDVGAAFPSRSGGALSARQAQARLASWCRRAGIKRVSPHALRHTFAQGLLRRTGDLAVVQRALTHRSITSTVVYARADDAGLRAALG